MLRSLEEVANASPVDYLAHAPKDPTSLAFHMIALAASKFPIVNRDDGVERIQNYELLYVGPGAGMVVQSLLAQGHMAMGMETSKRGIRYGSPDEVRSYVLWAKPWESPFPNKFRTPDSEQQKVRPMFHVVVINKFLKKCLTDEEWQYTLKEMKRLGRYITLFDPS